MYSKLQEEEEASAPPPAYTTLSAQPLAVAEPSICTQPAPPTTIIIQNGVGCTRCGNGYPEDHYCTCKWSIKKREKD